ncbi:MAG TPA: hypothetical protein VMB23_00735, partial [Spirochaetia bacterium]|nr:hypothetical protein [Spirochaetia bacterium]
MLRSWPLVLTSLVLLWSSPLLVHASGRSEPAPTIQMDDQPRQFLAPGNPDAKIHQLVLPFSTLTFTAQGQVIKSWTFTVFDSQGRVVSAQSRLETRDRGFFGELFNIGPRPQVEIPRELTWDGTYHRPGQPEDGTFVPDGNYTYQISILDSAGGRAQTPPFNVTVKNARIAVNFLRITPAIFSPLGARKTLAIDQSGSREFHWEGHFANGAGRVVRTVVWDNPSDNQAQDLGPPSFTWDGRDDFGAVVPDGVYTYTLVGYNRAGASLSTPGPIPVQVSERSGVVSLGSDVPLFSPRAKGAPQSIQLKPEVGTPEGLARWRIAVVDPSHPEAPRWTTSGIAPVPAQVEFQGLTSSGLALPEGRYQAILSVAWDNGNTADSAPLPFDLILSSPKASLTASAPVFGGPGRPGVTLSFQGEPGIPWDLDVLNSQGKPLRHYSLGDSGTGTVEFQGLDESGQPLPDGSLVVRAQARNQAGVPGFAQVSIRKDSRSMSLGLDLSRTTVVPGKGAAGTVRITPVLGVVDSIEKTVFTVVDPTGTKVAVRQADSIIPFWDWTSRGFDDKSVPDGPYQVLAEVTYSNGTVAKSAAD